MSAPTVADLERALEVAVMQYGDSVQAELLAKPVAEQDRTAVRRAACYAAVKRAAHRLAAATARAEVGNARENYKLYAPDRSCDFTFYGDEVCACPVCDGFTSQRERLEKELL